MKLNYPLFRRAGDKIYGFAVTVEGGEKSQAERFKVSDKDPIVKRCPRFSYPGDSAVTTGMEDDVVIHRANGGNDRFAIPVAG